MRALRLLPLLGLSLLGCAAGGAARPPAVTGAEHAQAQQPFFTAETASELGEMLWDEETVASQVTTEEERSQVVACILEEAQLQIPTLGHAQELGGDQVRERMHTIGSDCMAAHRERVLVAEQWSPSYPAVYASACTANVPEAAELCTCIAEQVIHQFESPAEFHAFEGRLESEDELAEGERVRFEALLASCQAAEDEDA